MANQFALGQKSILYRIKVKRKMLKEIIQSFLPWILYFILVGDTQLRLDIAILVAAVTTIFFEFNALKKFFILSWGTLMFFIFMTVAVVILRNKWVAQHAWLFSNGALTLIAWISILLRCPFTIQYAKEQVSADKWQHPLFLKINYLLSAVWGLMFLLGLALQVVKINYPVLDGWVYEVVSYLPSVFAIWVTTWFPDWYKNKYIQQ